MQEYFSGRTPPFANLAMRTTSAPISSLNLGFVDGCPIVALVRGKNEIVIQNLETQRRVFISPEPPSEVHKVIAFDSVIFKLINVIRQQLSERSRYCPARAKF